jgi:hypothetical protein
MDAPEGGSVLLQPLSSNDYLIPIINLDSVLSSRHIHTLSQWNLTSVLRQYVGIQLIQRYHPIIK